MDIAVEDAEETTVAPATGTEVIAKTIVNKMKVTCYCDKKGHFQSDCHAMKRAKDAAKKETKDEATKNSNTNGSSSSYSNSLPKSIACVSLKADSKFVGVAQSTNYDSWLINSGASEHVSGHKSDFTSIKRWREGQQEVEIADGTILPVEGYGDIVVITSHGKLLLRDVWYAPGFKCRLISCPELPRMAMIACFQRDNTDYTRQEGCICRRSLKWSV